LLSGEVMVSKMVKIDVPKKYLGNENKSELIK
jgi:putative transposon-encoded protein